MNIEELSISFWLNVLAGAAVFFGGVWWTNRQWRRERAKKALGLKNNLIQAFRFNLARIAQCLQYLRNLPPSIPNFRLDTTTVIAVIFNGWELFEDKAFFERFSWQRYQLEHINAKLDYLHIYLTSSCGSPATDMVSREFDSLVKHLLVVQKEISELLSDYEKTN